MKLRFFDYVALVVALGVATAFSLYAYTGVEQGSQVRIQSEKGTFLYPLDADREIAVAGPIGDTHVQIRDGQVRVEDSPCRDKICVLGGWISHSGEWLACLPNGVFVRVEGADTGPVDAQTF